MARMHVASAPAERRAAAQDRHGYARAHHGFHTQRLARNRWLDRPTGDVRVTRGAPSVPCTTLSWPGGPASRHCARPIAQARLP